MDRVVLNYCSCRLKSCAFTKKLVEVVGVVKKP